MVYWSSIQAWVDNAYNYNWWFSNFNKMLDGGNGMPNAALTIADDDESKDVVVSVL